MPFELYMLLLHSVTVLGFYASEVNQISRSHNPEKQTHFGATENRKNLWNQDK